MALKIIFMGTPEFAVPILKSIQKSDHKIIKVYTQPAKKKDRGQKIQNSAINVCADQLNLSVRCPVSFDTQNELDYFKSLDPDLVIVVAYGKILPKKLLDLKKIPFINVHASILPKWRGAAPIQRSIMNLDKETGISIMRINEELDSGPVSEIYKIKLDEKLNAMDVSEKLSDLAAHKILDCIDNIFDEKLKFIDQDHSKATYAKKILKSEGQIDWNDDALKIIGKINGLYPSPGAFFNFDGQRYKILKAEITNGIGKSGEVISDSLEIACGNKKSIKILEIQREGKKVQKIGEFMLGSQIKKGTLLANV